MGRGGGPGRQRPRVSIDERAWGAHPSQSGRGPVRLGCRWIIDTGGREVGWSGPSSSTGFHVMRDGERQVGTPLAVVVATPGVTDPPATPLGQGMSPLTPRDSGCFACSDCLSGSGDRLRLRARVRVRVRVSYGRPSPVGLSSSQTGWIQEGVGDWSGDETLRDVGCLLEASEGLLGGLAKGAMITGCPGVPALSASMIPALKGTLADRARNACALQDAIRQCVSRCSNDLSNGPAPIRKEGASVSPRPAEVAGCER